MSLLEVESLSKRFGGVTAVDDCSLSIELGSITGLIGPNGSGKTTVFNLITGFIATDFGNVRFNGRSISGLGPNRIYGLGIGRTFQLARIFPRLTALENMLVPVRRSGMRALFSRGQWHEERTRAMDMLAAMDSKTNEPSRLQNHRQSPHGRRTTCSSQGPFLVSSEAVDHRGNTASRSCGRSEVSWATALGLRTALSLANSTGADEDSWIPP